MEKTGSSSSFLYLNLIFVKTIYTRQEKSQTLDPIPDEFDFIFAVEVDQVHSESAAPFPSTLVICLKKTK